MAFTECSKCGKEMPAQALACPHCGCPVAATPPEAAPPSKPTPASKSPAQSGGTAATGAAQQAGAPPPLDVIFGNPPYGDIRIKRIVRNPPYYP